MHNQISQRLEFPDKPKGIITRSQHVFAGEEIYLPACVHGLFLGHGCQAFLQIGNAVLVVIFMFLALFDHMTDAINCFQQNIDQSFCYGTFVITNFIQQAFNNVGKI